MLRLITTRVLLSIPLFAFVVAVVFTLLHFAPGDAAMAVAGGDGVSAAELEAVRERLGLNRPLYVQYFDYLGSVVRGDMGTSLTTTRSVSGEVFSKLPITLSLTAGALLVAVVVALPLGTIAAVRAGSIIDRFVTFTATLGISMPNFFVGLLLIVFVALPSGRFPTSGYTPLSEGVIPWFSSIALPSIALGAAVAAELARHLRASLRDVLERDYIRTARSRGLSGLKVVGKHGLKNAAIPVVTVLGLQLRTLVGGSVTVEAVFGLPGPGTLMIRAVFGRDYPMIMGVVLVTVVMVLFINLLVDISYGYFNPKVRST